MTTTEKTALDAAVFNTASKLKQMQQGTAWGKSLDGEPMIKRRDIHMCMEFSGLFRGSPEDREGMALSASINRLADQGRLVKVEKGNRVFVIVK